MCRDPVAGIDADSARTVRSWREYKAAYGRITAGFALAGALSWGTAWGAAPTGGDTDWSPDFALLSFFAVTNQNPFIRVFGIPSTSPVLAHAAGRKGISLTLDLANNYTETLGGGEAIVIDGETYRATLRAVHRIGPQWEAGFEFPVVAHRGGILDGFINDWHQFWHFPTLGRDRVEDNRLSYRYQRRGAERIAITESTDGVGDLVLFVGRQLVSSPSTDTALRAQIKLPTGDPQRLTGSGGWDAALWWQRLHRLRDRWWAHLSAGATYLGPGEVLPELQRHWVGFGGLGVAWQPWRRLAFKAQLDMQTAVFRDSGLEQLTGTAAQITLGGSTRLNRRTVLDFAVVEDEPTTDVSPDVSFQLRLRSQF